MIVTGAFFADHAAVVDNKLVVVGGVWDNFFIGAGKPMAIEGHLVVLFQTDSTEDEQSVVTIDIFGPDGEKLSAIKAECGLSKGTGHGFFREGLRAAAVPATSGPSP